MRLLATLIAAIVCQFSLQAQDSADSPTTPVVTGTPAADPDRATTTIIASSPQVMTTTPAALIVIGDVSEEATPSTTVEMALTTTPRLVEAEMTRVGASTTSPGPETTSDAVASEVGLVTTMTTSGLVTTLEAVTTTAPGSVKSILETTSRPAVEVESTAAPLVTHSATAAPMSTQLPALALEATDVEIVRGPTETPAATLGPTAMLGVTDIPTVTLATAKSSTVMPAVADSPTATSVVTDRPIVIDEVTDSPTSTPAVMHLPTATPAVTPLPSESPTVTPVVTHVPTTLPEVVAATDSPTVTPAATHLPTATPVVTQLPTLTPDKSVLDVTTVMPAVTDSPTVTLAGTSGPTALPSVTVTEAVKVEHTPCSGLGDAGQICHLCAPGYADCVETAVLKICQHGKCLTAPEYRPCAGKSDGTSCRLCAPWDSDCLETTEKERCIHGECKAASSYNSCAGKSDRQRCRICAPWDRDCVESESAKACQYGRTLFLSCQELADTSLAASFAHQKVSTTTVKPVLFSAAKLPKGSVVKVDTKPVADTSSSYGSGVILLPLAALGAFMTYLCFQRLDKSFRAGSRNGPYKRVQPDSRSSGYMPPSLPTTFGREF